MPRFSLLPHPDYPPLAVESVSATVGRLPEGGLRLEFSVEGTSALIVPKERVPSRADGLWRTTCFELFVRLDDTQYYQEFNFSPSLQWAAYAFDGYRVGMVELGAEGPEIETTRLADTSFFLAARPWRSHALPEGGSIALTAVLEEAGGVKSFWALAHPPGAPDFHHPACFTARLPAPERP